jgi:ABC-type Zn uptake system ZnuABC Zn-binding protein ZnuA
MEPLRGTQIAAYHESWEYLARRFGLEIVGTLEPKPGIPPSPSHLAQLMDRMNELDVRLILKEPYYENKNPELVARETSARVVELPNQPQAGQDYLEFVDALIDRIAAAARGTGGAP